MLQTAINLLFIVAAIAATLSLADSAVRIWQFINRSN
jgi:hypothetical protein